MLYKALVRSHLEYAIAVWCPYKKGDISSLDKVQRRATKLIGSINHVPYVDRLKKLKLPTLKYLRARVNMIEVFKILHGFMIILIISLSRLTLELLQGVLNINCIKVLLNMILKSTFSLIEWCHYGIVYWMKLWILTLLIVLEVDLIILE